MDIYILYIYIEVPEHFHFVLKSACRFSSVVRCRSLWKKWKCKKKKRKAHTHYLYNERTCFALAHLALYGWYQSQRCIHLLKTMVKQSKAKKKKQLPPHAHNTEGIRMCMEAKFKVMIVVYLLLNRWCSFAWLISIRQQQQQQSRAEKSTAQPEKIDSICHFFRCRRRTCFFCRFWWSQFHKTSSNGWNAIENNFNIFKMLICLHTLHSTYSVA